uniref:OSJNBa0084K01.6 protein n=1 Tax=Oryza sativa subsp. japonica TaxID=39947 RepID=Q7XM25_ORYSJ|nr:OSJNBa0084K01.6 [Oryza sativa Japonica Group]
MAFSSFSWPFRRRGGGGGGGPSKTSASSAAAAAAAAAGNEEEELGVTPQLLDFLRTLSPDSFKSSALQLQGNSHTLAISISISSFPLRSGLDRDVRACFSQGWKLANSPAGRSGTPCSCSPKPRYELRAIQKEKVRRMETENGKAKDVTTVEVEMQESKCSRDSQTLPGDEESQDS